jgi:hypothetical protein
MARRRAIEILFRPPTLIARSSETWNSLMVGRG